MFSVVGNWLMLVTSTLTHLSESYPTACYSAVKLVLGWMTVLGRVNYLGIEPGTRV